MNPQLDDIPVPQEKKNYTLPIIIGTVVALILISVATYFYIQYSASQAKERAAQQVLEQQKEAKAAKEAALRQGTVTQFEKNITDESRYDTSLSDRFLNNSTDAVLQEITDTKTVGENDVPTY